MLGLRRLRDLLIGAWLRLGNGAQGCADGAEVDHLYGPARASAHAQPAQQGLHATGHPIAAGYRRRRHREVLGRGRPRQL